MVTRYGILTVVSRTCDSTFSVEYIFQINVVTYRNLILKLVKGKLVTKLVKGKIVTKLVKGKIVTKLVKGKIVTKLVKGKIVTKRFDFTLTESYTV